MPVVRDVNVSYQSVRYWCLKFGYLYARKIRPGVGQPDDTWHLDEVFISIREEHHYLWRAVGQDGETLDIPVPPRRDKRAAHYRIIKERAFSIWNMAASAQHTVIA